VLADSERSPTGSDAIVRRIKSVRIHEDFHTYNFNNDIAIIEMDQPVSLDGVVRAACLPADSKFPLLEQKYYAPFINANKYDSRNLFY